MKRWWRRVGNGADRGAGALTLAELAMRLKPPSLFNHIDGMASLKRELTMLALRELAATLGNSAIGESRNDAVRALTAAYREASQNIARGFTR